MDRTASYFIVISRTHDGYQATAPAFPELRAGGRSARLAYARLKLSLKTILLQLLASGRPLPRDPVIQSRTLRVDLWYLREQEELQ